MASEEAPEAPARRGIHVPAWLLVAAGAAIVFAIGVVVALAINGDGDSDRREVGGRFREGFGDGGGHHGRGIVLLIVVLVAIGVAVYFLVRHFSRRTRQPRALEVLEDRFARGEIDDDEFRRRREALTG